MNRISVVIPAFNEVRELPATLTAVLAQTEAIAISAISEGRFGRHMNPPRALADGESVPLIEALRLAV